MKTFGRTTALAAAAVLGLSLVPAVGAQEPREDVSIRAGDLVTASGSNDSLIRLRPRRGGQRYKLAKIPMGTRLKPKSVTHSAFCEKVAIANSINVVIYDTWTDEIEILEHGAFGLIADVEYDMQCNLIIADMGGDSVGRKPHDGELWIYTSEGHLRRLPGQHKWSNPAYLDMDEWGTLFVVDKGAGPKMPGTNGQWHFDAIYKMGAPRYTRPKERYTEPGLTVTSFAVHPDGTLLVGNGETLLRVDKNTAWTICAGSEFRRINGVDLNARLQVFIVDGFDIFEDTAVYRLEDDYSCALDVLADGVMVRGAQGIAAGLPRR